MNTLRTAALRATACAMLASLLPTGSASAQVPGTLDPSFGIGGRVTTPLAANNDRAHAVQVTVNERVIVVGESASGPNSSNNLTVARYLPNGLLDTSFGSAGVTRIDGGGGGVDFGYALAIQPDRKLLAAGAVTAVTYSDFGVARFNDNGTVDSTFGGAGIARINMAPVINRNDYATAVARQGNGKIVLGGVAFATEGAFDYARFGLVRFDSGGVLDSSFGNGGRVRIHGNAGLNTINQNTATTPRKAGQPSAYHQRIRCR